MHGEEQVAVGFCWCGVFGSYPDRSHFGSSAWVAHAFVCFCPVMFQRCVGTFVSAKFALQTFGPIYNRFTALEKKIVASEGGSAAVTVCYGHAAQLLAFSYILQPGDHFIAAVKHYGGTCTGRRFKQIG